ncbi:hypothetical protein [Nocardia cyriacigeorgica]|uniref:hypothetical protein n=1 Tax=Nocardia cyriacigeorgica TaxID=135487 RepID=UPI0013D31A59|nr:hypothetical protein [Nocardia cyriacigeorgica]MBF6439896.1 hypothetical protein [Nocardia cyriacigeorgica]MBF6455924.1 hypothetical protein [Nocardia cyriacigeorgica]MBF6482099.1 hypothetical protein [Nocardia cyriacigeorgica]MBF6553335.1 hypothetical protein [Nocardia cyriacigeorgica]NEW30460.1 hypothetical protein [Nocardia cyriacigeorgica]
MLDRDSTPEVLRPVQAYVYAMTSGAGQVGAAVGDFTLTCRPSSSLDHALVGELDWITETFGNAVRSCLGRADIALREAVDGANAHDIADILGAAAVRGHRPV